MSARPVPGSVFEPAILVTMCGRHGWDSRLMSLAQFARARANLERLDVLFVDLVGALA